MASYEAAVDVNRRMIFHRDWRRFSFAEI